MDTLIAIAARRSIRKYKDTAVEEEKLQAILLAATQAPSGKNRQPWRFVVVKGDTRSEMVRIMKDGIANSKKRGDDPGSSEGTMKVMEQAPATVFIFNPQGLRPWQAHSTGQPCPGAAVAGPGMFDDVVNIQSIGASIQNMLLAAQDQGLGSLWICDVFYAYEELCAWLGEEGELIAAVTLGYPDEKPAARPRKPVGEVARVM